mmetsp:Transcript_565/g.1372  ORF Transcript_565/g.1372 Transcript_565/m.1372 type:complete len:223 (-) Transcript_565:3-671(-)
MYVNIAITTWQSKRSVKPPCPGILAPKSLMRNARFKPLAKKPPNGAMRAANSASTRLCKCSGEVVKVTSKPSLSSVSRTHGNGTVLSTHLGGMSSVTSMGWNVSSLSQSSHDVSRKYESDLAGHVIQRNFIRKSALTGAMSSVMNRAPMNPSSVFLGDSLMSCVRPNAFPKRYAMTSFHMTSHDGSTNQISPLKTLDTKNELCANTTSSVMCIHAKCTNCSR